jgi:hypothetical protein
MFPRVREQYQLEQVCARCGGKILDRVPLGASGKEHPSELFQHNSIVLDFLLLLLLPSRLHYDVHHNQPLEPDREDSQCGKLQ